MSKILVVDDEIISTLVLTSTLQEAGHDVRSAVDAGGAVQEGKAFAPDLIISDWILKGGGTGIDVVRSLREENPAVKVIFVTGLPAHELEQQLRAGECDRICEKPIELDEMLRHVEKLLADAVA